MKVAFTSAYQHSLVDLEGVEIKRVTSAVSQFLKDPDHPGLNFEALKGKHQRRLFTIRGSKELRVLLAREGEIMVLLYAGHHDDVYDLAERKYFLAGRQEGLVGFFDYGSRDVDASQTSRSGPASSAPVDDRPGVVDHWTHQELIEAGFGEAQVEALRGLKDPNNLLDKVPDLDDDQLDLVLKVMEISPDQHWNPEPDASPLRDAFKATGGLGDLSELYSPEEFAQLTSEPIEAWMVFLHPDQRGLVTKSFSGPARVRGSAGTGKTVVALHRAAHLAAKHREQGSTKPILFTTFIKSLPPVFERLYLRLPGVQAGEVEFNNIDKVARAVCDDAGDRVNTIPTEINKAYRAAWKEVVRSASPLAKDHLSADYLNEEIVAVIKGRGLRTVDEYLEIDRTGRSVPLGRAQRQQVWELMDAWDGEMANRGTIDFADVILRARDHARRIEDPPYAGVIIDEAQDLTLVGLQLCRALVNGTGRDRPDGLFLVGDGAQRIYPGGYTLRQAGVEVRGRTKVLENNYRNTAEVIGAAMVVAGDAPVDDLGDRFRRGDAPANTDREGQTPFIVECEDFESQLDEIAAYCNLYAAADDGSAGVGDMAVLVSTNQLAKNALAGLKQRGIACMDISRYQGRPTELLKVGTFHRAKGLEFKVVFLPALSDTDFPPGSGSGEAESEERAQLALSQLFVAMTRARDNLIVLYSNQPASVLANAEGAFDHRVRLDAGIDGVEGVGGDKGEV